MKFILQGITVLFLFNIAVTSSGQTVDTIFGCDNIPASNSVGASCTICNFDILYGNSFGFSPSPDAGWCGTIENDQYIGFVVGFTGRVVFQMDVFNCTNGSGLQVGIYDSNNSLVGDCFNQIFPGSQETFTATGLLPGAIYYLRIDGFAGDDCEFNIQVVSGLISAGPDAPGPIMGPQSVCWDDTYNYVIDPVPNAFSYYWKVTPGLYTTGVTVDPPEAIDPISGTSGLGIEVSVPMADPNMPLGTCDEILLEVFPLNNCFTSLNSSTYTIEVCRSVTPPDTIFLNESYLYCETVYTYPPSGQRYTEGQFYFTNTDSNGQRICEETVALTVERIGSPMEVDVISNPISCNMNGNIDLGISGGLTPYTFSWSNGDTISNPTNLDSGFYSLSIVDNIGCSFDTTLRVRHISEERISFSTNGTDCNGNGGSASIDTTLLNNYQIEWSTGATGININNLTNGRYGVSIIDSTSGCRLDSFFNIGALPSCYSTISGTVVSDRQINCQSPGMYTPLPGVMIECSNGERQFTDINGNYSFLVDTGTYTVTAQNIRPANLLPRCATSYNVLVDTYEDVFPNNDFYFERTGNPDIALTMVKSTPRRGRQNRIDLEACNYDSLAASFSVTLEFSDLQEYDFSIPQPSSIDVLANTVTWEMTDLESFACRGIRVVLITKVSTMVGDSIMYTAFTDSTTTSIDATPIDNEISCKAVAVGSYDPNDKLVTPLGEGEEGIIELSDSLLQYTIRFQNTGSDDAWYIRLEDEISENLDINSMKVIGASHDFSANFNEDRNLIVVFDPIVLPPAMTDSLGSQGYFSFTIETTGDLEPADRIENTAAIYFDFNDPIITNTTVNTIRSASSTHEIAGQESFVIFPNPNKGEFTVRLDQAHTIQSIHLISMDGRLLPSLDFQGAGRNYKLNLYDENVTQGIYTLRLTLASGEVMHRLFVLQD